MFKKILKRRAVNLLLAAFVFCAMPVAAQVRWVNVDSSFGPLPANFHVYKTTDSLDGKPFIACYASMPLKDKQLEFTTDTTYKRRLTPNEFYERNHHPLLLVNCSFFSFETNANLNLVMKEERLLAYNIHSFPMKGKDTGKHRFIFGSAIGIDKYRNADIAWVYTDSSKRYPYATQKPMNLPGIAPALTMKIVRSIRSATTMSHRKVKKRELKKSFHRWKMKTAVGGGPVLVQEGKIHITNEEELKFTGKAIADKHPRTAMGYTNDGQLIVMVIEGRYPGRAEGATLEQEAQLLLSLGCTEALNLDGGGSSCMLINGKETIKPSGNGVQRQVPAVFIVSHF